MIKQIGAFLCTFGLVTAFGEMLMLNGGLEMSSIMVSILGLAMVTQ